MRYLPSPSPLFPSLRDRLRAPRSPGAMGLLTLLRASRPSRALALLAPLCVLLCAAGAVLAVPAGAAPALGWSSPVQPAGAVRLTGVSCSSRSLCVAVGHGGVALASTDPAAAGSWHQLTIPGGGELTGVSCPTGELCVAVDEAGKAFVSSSPATSSWLPVAIDGTTALTGISCASTGLCVAVDHEGRALVSTDPAVGGGGGWHSSTIDSGTALTGVSCAPSGPCAAIDGDGAEIVSADPADTGWSRREVAFSGLTAVSCYDTPRACVALDADGETIAGVEPEAGAGATWSTTAVDALASPTGISCDPAALCVAVDGSGSSFASDDASSVPPAWPGIASTPAGLTGVSCVAEGMCVAVGSGGQIVTAFTPVPSATTQPASDVQRTTALVSGTVDPQDAALSTCSFEYGTTTNYGSTAACANAPTGSGQEPVSAALTGLATGTTYYYRLVAATAAGTAEGSAESFRTVAAAIVEPHPSIKGVPAPGQRLTCSPGVETTSGVTLTYAWLRNTQTIAGVEGSTYGVSPEDVSDDLQCRVTATTAEGSRTATSAFVTVPAGGLGTISETTVGTPRVSRDRVSVPLKCSAQADGSCKIQLSLTVQETLNGKRVVAIAASDRRKTVTIGSRTVKLRPSQGATATVSPNATGLALLARMHSLQARFEVSGTVLGAISAALKSATVTLAAPPKSSSHKPAHGHKAAHSAARAHASGRGAAHAAAHSVARESHIRRDARPVGRSLIAAHAASGGATPTSVLAPTPYMGWDTYFTFGANYDEASVLEQASELKTRGLERDGYRYIWLDVGWWKGKRSASGEIEVNSTQWPHGMRWLASTLHAAGFKVGLYTDAGTQGCGGPHEGSYGHYQQDVNTFAAWGFDAVKVDFCGGIRQGLNPATAYAQFHEAIVNNSSHRPMLLSICNYLQPGQFEKEKENPAFANSAFASYTFGPSVGNSWRTDTDVGVPGNVEFGSVLRNLDADAAQPQAAGPGHWNDPDYLGPDQGMTEAQFRTQFSMWAMLAAPLMVSANMVSLSSASQTALSNREVIAIDQDPAGLQARLLGSSGNGQVWVKPLADGDRAVALLNRGGGTLQISTSTGAIEMPAASGYRVRNLWTGAVTRVAAGAAIGASVPADSTVLLRVSPT